MALSDLSASVSERVRLFLAERALRRDRPENEARRRWTAIFMSVVVAFGLWLTFSMRESYSVVVEMPLVVTDLPEGRALSRLPQPLARVTVQGEGWDLLALSRRPPALAVDAQEARLDVLSAASDGTRLPPGVSVQSVVPAVVELELEPRITRVLPVRPRLGFEPAPLYELLAEPTVWPDTVVVSGARSILNSLDAWPTQTVTREPVTESFTETVLLSDTLAGLVELSLGNVELTVEAALYTEATRELEVRTEGTPPGADPVRLIPSTITVTYRVPVDEFDRAQASEQFYATVNYASAINDTTGTVQPLLNLPDELHLRDPRPEPRRLQYRIRVE